MKPDKRFSRYIMGSFMIFLGMSFILVAKGHILLRLQFR